MLYYGAFIADLKQALAEVTSDGRCSVKKMFLKALQNSQGNTFLIKLQAWGLQLYQKRDSDTSVFLLILQNV